MPIEWPFRRYLWVSKGFAAEEKDDYTNLLSKSTSLQFHFLTPITQFLGWLNCHQNFLTLLLPGRLSKYSHPQSSISAQKSTLFGNSFSKNYIKLYIRIDGNAVSRVSEERYFCIGLTGRNFKVVIVGLLEKLVFIFSIEVKNNLTNVLPVILH